MSGLMRNLWGIVLQKNKISPSFWAFLKANSTCMRFLHIFHLHFQFLLLQPFLTITISTFHIPIPNHPIPIPNLPIPFPIFPFPFHFCCISLRSQIADFGVSEEVERSDSELTKSAGTPAFTAPECLSGE